MVEIVCALLAAVASVLCAWTGKTVKKSQGDSEKRAKEAKLQLAMIRANSELTKGIAIALQNGKCNGEVHSGLEAVEKADEEYRMFLEESALEDIRK